MKSCTDKIFFHFHFVSHVFHIQVREENFLNRHFNLICSCSKTERIGLSPNQHSHQQLRKKTLFLWTIPQIKNMMTFWDPFLSNWKVISYVNSQTMMFFKTFFKVHMYASSKLRGYYLIHLLLEKESWDLIMISFTWTS